MKKVSYSLNLGLVGSINSGRNIFIKYFEKVAFETSFVDEDLSKKKYFEFLLVYNQIPIKLKVFAFENLTEITYNYDKVKNLDVIILTLNVFELNSINNYVKKDLEEVYEYLAFRGFSILVGVNTIKIIENIISIPEENRISRNELVKKAKELDLLYCYEILDVNRDIPELFNRLLKDFTHQFQFSSPELFERAKAYGMELTRQKI